MDAEKENKRSKVTSTVPGLNWIRCDVAIHAVLVDDVFSGRWIFLEAAAKAHGNHMSNTVTVCWRAAIRNAYRSITSLAKDLTAFGRKYAGAEDGELGSPAISDHG